MATSCDLKNLVSSDISDVQYCDDCGLFHISMGPMSIRLSKAHYLAFVRDLNLARNQLRDEELHVHSVPRQLHS
jgi:hypothetical protein